MYELEKKKLLGFSGSPELNKLLAELGCWCAGGAVTSLFTNRDINDLDIYFPNKEALVKALAVIYNKVEDLDESVYDKHFKGLPELGSFEAIALCTSDKSITLNCQGAIIQFMTFKYFDSAEDIFDCFDFTCCMGAYSYADDEFKFQDDFFKHNSQRYLKFHSGTHYPLMSMMRINKYKEKGYYLSKPEFTRMILTCMTVELNSWDEAAIHLGGMYGRLDGSIFNRDEEFSMSALVNQLGDLEPFDLDKEVMDSVELYDLLQDIIPPIKTKYVVEGFFEGGYFYKTVKEDNTSPYRSHDAITYNVGSVVNGGPRGIYVDTKELLPSFPKCVKMEGLLNHNHNKMLGTVTGDLLVVDVKDSADVGVGPNNDTATELIGCYLDNLEGDCHEHTM